MFFVPDRFQRVFYGWWLVGLSGFVMVIATVPLFHAMSVWAVALERNFGWNRTQLGFALTFTRVEGGLMGPLEGYLTDKVGTRRMVFIGLTILGAGFIFFGQVQNLWMFYLAYILMAMGQGLGSWIPLMTMLNRWFSRRRALAIGWANAGSRLGALILVPVIAWYIDPDQDRLGWRMTATILGVFILVIAGPVSRLIRNTPQDYGLLPDGDRLPEADGIPSRTQGGRPGPRATRTQESDYTASEAIRTPAFWLIAFGHGFSSMVILAVMAHLGLLMGDKGFQVQNAAFVVAVYTGVAMVFQLVGGYMGDHVPKGLAMALFTAIQAAGLMVLVFADTLAMFYVFAVIFGIGFGGRNPLVVAIRADYFGTAAFGKILGLSAVPMNLLSLTSAPFAGWMRDSQGDYALAFLILTGLNMAGAVCFLFARRPARRMTPQTDTVVQSSGDS